MTNLPRRFSLPGIIRGLMLSDHLGDVRDEINHLCDLAGIPRPQGGFEEGWTDDDWHNVKGANGLCDWDQVSYCTELGCREPATHLNLVGIINEDPIYEMVCCSHALKEGSDD